MKEFKFRNLRMMEQARWKIVLILKFQIKINRMNLCKEIAIIIDHITENFIFKII